MPFAYYAGQAALRQHLGLIVPSWFPPDFEVAEAVAVMRANLADLETVHDPGNCLVVVDGSEVAVTAARALLAEGLRFELLELTDGPHGKGGAVGRGLEALLARPRLEAFVVRDHDGDHFLDDTPRLARLGLQMLAEGGSDLILVNGGRDHPARPMGWPREQYERLVNEVVWRGLHYHAARLGRAVDERFLRLGQPVPDFQSGYKLYSRAAAERVAAAYLAADWAARRWGCEVVATVEVIAAGGQFGEIQRACLDQQPLTTYEGDARRADIHGAILLGACRRLALPTACVLTWFDAAVARGLLRTLGSELTTLAALRRQVAEGLGADPGEPGSAAWIA